METSAKDSTNVDTAFRTIAEAILKRINKQPPFYAPGMEF